MSNIFPQFTDEKFEQLRTHPYFADDIKKFSKIAEEFLHTEPPQIKFSAMHLFETTGNRSVHESVYFNYGKRLNVYFFMYLLTKDEKYLTALSDIIWNICDFETWTLPAHVKESETLERRRGSLALFSTALGFRIAEVLYFIGDKLPELVYRRAKNELRERIINPFRDRDDFWWYTIDNNWSAVCTAGIFATYVYAAEREETDAMLPKMLAIMDCYLKGFDNDGCCREGYNYWSYGFSHYCMFADMLRGYTDGKTDLFKDEKIHAIARFQQNATINKYETVSFSDCATRFAPDAYLSHFLKNEYNDIEIPTFKKSNEKDPALRRMLWQDPTLANCTMSPKSTVFHEAQWYIKHTPAYSMAIKGGCNNESHNHNDIGSFLISKGDEVSFTDAGTGEYTKQYFSSERYTILANSARGHSVPIINGEYQTVGTRKSEVLCENENEYCITIDNGYDIPSLSRLTRRVVCESEKIVLTDSYTFAQKPTSVVERFVSFHEPKSGDGYVTCGNCTLRFDPALYSLSVGSEEFVRSATDRKPLYFVDLAVNEPKTGFEFTVVFE